MTLNDQAKLYSVIECPECHVRHFKLIKKNSSDSTITIVCGGCDKKIGKVEDFFVKNCDD